MNHEMLSPHVSDMTQQQEYSSSPTHSMFLAVAQQETQKKRKKMHLYKHLRKPPSFEAYLRPRSSSVSSISSNDSSGNANYRPSSWIFSDEVVHTRTHSRSVSRRSSVENGNWNHTRSNSDTLVHTHRTSTSLNSQNFYLHPNSQLGSTSVSASTTPTQMSVLGNMVMSSVMRLTGIHENEKVENFESDETGNEWDEDSSSSDEEFFFANRSRNSLSNRNE